MSDTGCGLISGGTRTPTCYLSVINTTCELTVPANTLVEPPIIGHELLNLPTCSFWIKHEDTGRQVLFDLGCRKDYWNLPPPIVQTIDSKVPGIRVEKDPVDILTEGGIDVDTIESAIISHHHYDHIGNPASFLRTMQPIVGPGFSDEFLRGFPTATSSPAFEDAFEGRKVHEVKFSDGLQLLGFQAYDYFDDSSLYILSAPGHAIGHLSALVKTTPDSYVFLGSDVCHFPGVFRPTPNVPMPGSVLETELLSKGDPTRMVSLEPMMLCHPCVQEACTTPFYSPCSRADSWYCNPSEAQDSVDLLKGLDSRNDILVLIAHDPALLDGVPGLLDGTLNGWRESGLKKQLRWRFLNELPRDVKPSTYLVQGTYLGRELTRTLSGTILDKGGKSHVILMDSVPSPTNLWTIS